MIPVLHGYWRSGTSYRVRIALNLKGVAYDQVGHDLRTGAQRAPDYLALAPQGLVPALEADGLVLTQSPAILEWIDERWPAPPLLPADRDGRARVRAMAALIACDVHPLGNLRVLKAVKALGGDETAWARGWIEAGFAALERQVGDGGFCFGDAPTLADCCLMPQLYSAARFGVDMAPYPGLAAIGARMDGIEAVAAAHPSRQPDAD